MDGEIIIGTKLDTKGFDLEIKATKDKLDGLVEEYKILQRMKPYEGQEKDLREYQEQIEKTRNKLVSLRQKQDDLNKSELSKIPTSLNSIGNGIDGIVKKVIRWGLAIFSIRSAYNLIRQSVGTLSQYNETLSSDIEYIRFAIANALAPVIEKIVNLAYKLLVYVGYIIKQLFGVNIFANSSAKAFEKQKNALSGSNKEAKKLQKTLAGFDEMNIISENGNVSRGGGGGGVALPSQDLKDLLENFEPPAWLDKLVKKLKILKEWLEKNWDWLSKVLKAIGIVFGASKIAGWVSNIGNLIGGAGTGLTGMGLALGVIGVELGIIAVQSYKAYTEYKQLDKEYKNMAKAGKKYYEAQDKIKEASKDTNSSTEDLTTSFNHFNSMIELSTSSIKGANKATKDLNAIESFFDQTILKSNGTYKQRTDAIKKNTKEINENIENVRDMKIANTLTEEQEKQWIQTLKNLIPQLENERENVVKNSDEYNMLTNTIDTAKYNLKMFEDGNVTATESSKGLGDSILEAAGKIAEFNNTKLEDKRATIKVDSDTSSAENGLTGWIRRFASKIQDVFNGINFSGLASKISNGINKLFPILGLSKIKKAFGLAKGGIVNLPGKGVPIGGAITGEKQQEGVIPLTDSQQMNLLGEAIGKYITINLTNITELDGRTIARKVQEVNNNTNFLLNR